jgi:subtilisin family serine protease
LGWTHPADDACAGGKSGTATFVSEEAAPYHGPVEVPADPGRARAEFLSRTGITQWHEQGIRGLGIKIALLDSGFRGYRTQLGMALPSHVTCRSFRLDGNLEARDSQHGILCGEVIHAVAPDAELLLANWEPDRPDLFLEAVAWAKGQGARIISCSLIMPSWSNGEGGGSVDQALGELLGSGNAANDVLFFGSAGNTANRHWRGAFHKGADGYHEWEPGQTANPLTPWSSEQVSVELYGSDDPPGDLEVVNEENGCRVGVLRRASETQLSWESVRFQPKPGAYYSVRLHGSTKKSPVFHLVVLGGNLLYARADGSVSFPADGDRALAVGAVDSQGQRLEYSSCGRSDHGPKPDFVAMVPFPSLWRQRPFSGTSAAAPQAAAIAALCMSRHPNLSAAQVRSLLQQSARDLGPPGPDCETGFGLICLPAESSPRPGPGHDKAH